VEFSKGIEATSVVKSRQMTERVGFSSYSPWIVKEEIDNDDGIIQTPDKCILHSAREDETWDFAMFAFVD